MVSEAHSFSIMTLEVRREDDGFTGCKETGSLGSHLEAAPRRASQVASDCGGGKRDLYDVKTLRFGDAYSS